jgi:hypothetical protein
MQPSASLGPSGLCKWIVKEVMTMRKSSVLLVALAAGITGAAVRAAPAAAAKSNSEVAFDFFRQRGLTKAQSAGIVGNLVQESNVNPKADQAGGPGKGVAQWSSPGRWDSLEKYARNHHTSPWALNTQLWFIWHELTAVPAFGLHELRGAKTVAAATRVFERKYEICGECNEPRRVAEAQTTLRNFGA